MERRLLDLSAEYAEAQHAGELHRDFISPAETETRLNGIAEEYGRVLREFLGG